MIIFAGTNGYLDDLEVEQVRAFSEDLNKYVESMNPKLLDTIMQKKTIDDSIKAEIEKTLKEFKQRFVAERQTAVAKVEATSGR
jgi:F-type H+-transporting ATPase subunit alpha